MFQGTKRQADGHENSGKKQKTGGVSKVLHVRGIPSYTTEQELTSLVAPFGVAEKVFILPQKHQAFVQMQSIEAASAVLQALELSQPSIRSKDVYFQFSSRQEVTQSGVGGPNGTVPPPSMGGMGGDGEANSILLISITNVTLPVTLENVVQVCKPYGQVLRVITFTKGLDYQALVQMASADQAQNAKLFLDGKDMFQGCCHLRVNFSKRQNLVVKQNNHKSRDFTVNGGMPDPTMGRQFDNGMGGMGMGVSLGAGLGSPVVLVSRLPAENITTDTLFSLFGVYGDVTRVKILYNKRDTAMIQFNTPQQAQHAVQHLNGCPLYGTNISVATSKNLEVQMPRGDMEDGKELTQDYTGHEAHRFRKKTFINLKNVNGPSQVLHVANLHDAATEDELSQLFASQSPVLGVEFFKQTRKMAYVCMSSVSDAVAALIALHNYNLGGYPIRVSFSHKEPGTVQSGGMAAKPAV
jgi:RNA recognition motif-containing protein